MIRSRVCVRAVIFWAAVFAGIVPQLEASGLVTVPTGLAPGTQYRLVFVTDLTYGGVSDGLYQGLSANVVNYNDDVENEIAQIPQLAALGATWDAIVSTDAVSAAANIGSSPSSVGIYLLDGTTLIANGTGTTGAGLFPARNCPTSTTRTPASIWPADWCGPEQRQVVSLRPMTTLWEPPAPSPETRRSITKNGIDL